MPTTKKRLNITLSPALDEAIKKVARRDHVPEATKAAELISIALDIEEDFSLDVLAKGREASKERLISHKKAWS